MQYKRVGSIKGHVARLTYDNIFMFALTCSTICSIFNSEHLSLNECTCILPINLNIFG